MSLRCFLWKQINNSAMFFHRSLASTLGKRNWKLLGNVNPGKRLGTSLFPRMRAHASYAEINIERDIVKFRDSKCQIS